MQNVVLPSPRRARHAYRSPSHRTTLWERLHTAILPLDFSRTLTRLVLLLPSIYFLSKMLIVWTILVLQTCEVQLISGLNQNGPCFLDLQRHFEKLVGWTMNKEMAQICWSTFCAVCGAFWVEGLIKALDGLGGGGFPLGGNSLSPIHLVSASFQCLSKCLIGHRLAMHFCCIFIRRLLLIGFILPMICRLDPISTSLLRSLLPFYRYPYSALTRDPTDRLLSFSYSTYCPSRSDYRHIGCFQQP